MFSFFVTPIGASEKRSKLDRGPNNMYVCQRSSPVWVFDDEDLVAWHLRGYHTSFVRDRPTCHDVAIGIWFQLTEDIQEACQMEVGTRK